ncbi:hypothetical protein G6F63_016933 [Rhizopus arrhizus]|nr:hypothetical protein G6F22_021006 [Rhizopus arrhizus]KAG1293956.1 hypothetical protein G6F63_016933 [Rhizopus arrhizus]KAG1369076.1 hypothetical protein G6F60_015702 [Rhizopus arrhizus]
MAAKPGLAARSSSSSKDSTAPLRPITARMAPAVMPSSQCTWNRMFLNIEGGGPGRLPPASCATANEN